MLDRKGKCTNFGNCPVADSRQVIAVPAGKDLLPFPSAALPMTILVGLLAVSAGFWLGSPKPAATPDLVLRVIPASPDEVRVESGSEIIEVAAHGSATAFTDLRNGSRDIGISSRGIKADEGDFTSAASEPVLGLDGIAIVVNRANAVNALAAIFRCDVKDWAEVGGSGGAIDFTLATEEYALSRRLYPYTAATGRNPLALRFVGFALGKDIVAANGFVSQNVKAECVPSDSSSAGDQKLTSGAQRLSLNFQFKCGGDRVILLGIADGVGALGKNLALSKDWANAVAAHFEPRGVKPSVVTGFCAASPVAWESGSGDET